MSNKTDSSLMLNTNKLAAPHIMTTFTESAATRTKSPPIGAATARKAEKKAQKKSTKIAISQEAKKEQMRLEQIQKENEYINALKQKQAALIIERNKQLQTLPSTPSTLRVDFKQCWEGWKIRWISSGERLAIMTAKSYDDLVIILQEQARSECENVPITNIKPFYIDMTNWLPGVVTPARYHNDWLLEGQMRAGRIASVYNEYIKVMNQDTKSIDKVSDHILVKMVKILNSVGKDAWPFTLALSPVKIRTTYWQQDPIFKQIAHAFGDEMYLYLDNLEKIQKEYTIQY
jgi:hypothetical protein